MNNLANETKIVKGPGKVQRVILRFFKNAQTRMDICAAQTSGQQSEGNEAMAEAYFAIAKRGGRLRLITEITKDNAGYCKELMKTIELRHLEDIRSNFGVSDGEYIATPGAGQLDPTQSLLYSNEEPFVKHHQAMFNTLWARGTPAKERIGELERGIAASKTEVITDSHEIQRRYLQLIAQARKEVLLVLPSVNAFHRQEKIGAIDSLEKSARDRGVTVRILTPMDSSIEKRLADSGWRGQQTKPSILVQRVAPSAEINAVADLLVDGETSFIIEKIDDSAEDFIDAVDYATYSTRRANVRANTFSFESLWRASEMSQRQAVERNLEESNLLMKTEAWEITPVNFNFRCSSCGKRVDWEIRIYNPSAMMEQSRAASSAMEKMNAGRIPFCFECIRNHPVLKPAWFISS